MIRRKSTGNLSICSSSKDHDELDKEVVRPAKVTREGNGQKLGRKWSKSARATIDNRGKGDPDSSLELSLRKLSLANKCPAGLVPTSITTNTTTSCCSPTPTNASSPVRHKSLHFTLSSNSLSSSSILGRGHSAKAGHRSPRHPPPPSFVISPPTPIPGEQQSSLGDELSLKRLYKNHRGELSASEQYRYTLSRAQLKASSRTSAPLTGFAMIALVELVYLKTTPPLLLVSLAVVTTLLVSVHLLTLLISTCLLPHIEAHGCTKDSPHVKLKFYVDLSWLFSTFIGLLLFLVEIGIIFFVKFDAIGFDYAAWITTGILVPVLFLFCLLSYMIHRSLLTHFLERVNDKVANLQEMLMTRDAEMARGRGHSLKELNTKNL